MKPICTLFAVLTLVMAQQAQAQVSAPGGPGMGNPPPGPRMMRPGPGGPGMQGPRGRFMQRLNLNDEQRAQFERIVEETRRESWNTVGQLMSERFAMREMMRQDKVDSNAVVEQQRKIDELNRQVLKNRLEARNRIQAMLNPEQQRLFKSLPMRGMGRAAT